MHTEILAQGIHTRFLHSFRFRCEGSGELQRTADRLRASQVRDIAMWEEVDETTAGSGFKTRENYRAEVLQHVADFLFPPSKAPGCKYLRWTDRLTNAVFGHRLQSRGRDGADDAWRLEADVNVELFLNPYGIGLLSIGLSWMPETPMQASALLEFNYRLAQKREKMLHQLGMPMPTHPAALASPDVQPAPAADAPIDERLGRRGGWFDLVELKARALAPIADVMDIEPRRQFQVFTVVRFARGTNLASIEKRAEWAALASDYADVHEDGHAGTAPGGSGAAALLLNRNHWAAVSSVGAAHLLENQDIDYDEQRVVMARQKHFAPYLAAHAQWMYAEEESARLGDLVTRKDADGHLTKESTTELLRRWSRFLAFDSQCNHTEVSERSSVNRWYELVRAGLGSNAAWSRLRATLKDLHEFASLLEAQNRRAELALSAENARRSVAAIEHTQEKVEWVEIFVIAVYSIYLVHYLGEDFGFEEHYRGLCTLIGSTIAAVLAAVMLKPWKPYNPEHHKPRRTLGVMLLVLIIGALLAAYLTVGFKFFAGHH